MQINQDELQKNQKIKRQRKIQLCTVDTKYQVIKDVGLNLNFKIMEENIDNQWDLYWTDNAVQADQLAKMRNYQKINHWPGMFTLSRKNNLGIQLMRMRKKFQSYNYFPMTWIVPADNNDLKQQFNSKQNRIFIVKPEASCQGKGIFLVRKHQDIPPMESFVVQKYIDKPYLIDGLKFDLRLYVLLAGVDPLRVYMYKDGIARFATELYETPNQNNLNNICQHLTNYAINMTNPNYVFNQQSQESNIGHKRSFQSILQHLKNDGHDTTLLLNNIKEMFIKTFVSTQPIIAHHYRSCQPENYKNNMCFEILGMDVMIDNKLKPWLLEVNHTPSFGTDTPFDYQIKSNLISDTIKLLNINDQDRYNSIQKQKEEFERRILQGQKKVQLTAQQKQSLIEQGQKERDEWELNNLGNYEPITQILSQCEIQEYLNYSNQMYAESTGGHIKRNAFRENNIRVQQTQCDLDIPEINLDASCEKLKYVQNDKFDDNQIKISNYLRLHSPNSNKFINNNILKLPKEISYKYLNFDNKLINIQKLQVKDNTKQSLYFLPSIKQPIKSEANSYNDKSLQIKQLNLVAKSYLNISDAHNYSNKDKKKHNFFNN